MVRYEDTTLGTVPVKGGSELAPSELKNSVSFDSVITHEIKPVFSEA